MFMSNRSVRRHLVGSVEHAMDRKSLSSTSRLGQLDAATLVVAQADLLAKEPPERSYAYFSLLDPNSSDANFSGIGDSAYVYYVRSDEDHPPYVRVLFRQPVKLTLN